MELNLVRDEKLVFSMLGVVLEFGSVQPGLKAGL